MTSGRLSVLRNVIETFRIEIYQTMFKHPPEVIFHFKKVLKGIHPHVYSWNFCCHEQSLLIFDCLVVTSRGRQCVGGMTHSVPAARRTFRCWVWLTKAVRMSTKKTPRRFATMWNFESNVHIIQELISRPPVFQWIDIVSDYIFEASVFSQAVNHLPQSTISRNTELPLLHQYHKQGALYQYDCKFLFWFDSPIRL
jgi:hypothetical protein